ncbi:phosphotransferase enzyme family protein [Streptomyces pluripotens]|uniref:Phosphotransferase enzyme family protein n=1 Tax=Streptomyces pluripotens TaxID=1355015 RepID=A0A221P0H7_9ACTN|nr:phosphotransferase enzyme family protein [Streptomyces pluripotens]ASN25721.1 phosphotransferase enzyme family protein [Streptomyces pluripotens]KIE25039.1 phosphotransferase enzyme family protein [Streptomyces sp. MUSC 125]
MGAPPVPRPTAGGHVGRVRTDTVVREFVARAVAAGRTRGGLRHRDRVLPLTEPLAGLLDREPGTLVTVRVSGMDMDTAPVAVRTWHSEPEVLRALRGVLPVPECLVAGEGYAVHSHVDGDVLGDVCGSGKPVDALLLRDLAQLLASIVQVRGGVLPPLPSCWPDNHTDSQGFLRILARLADDQIRGPGGHRYGGLFVALGVPEGALLRFAERVPAMTRRPYGLLHGDLHRGNLVRPSAGDLPLHCLDWGLAGYGDPLHDLAVHLVRMRYPDHQWCEVVDAWADAVHRVRPAAVAGLAKDLRHYLAFEYARALYADVIRAVRSLEDSFDRRSLDEATAVVRAALCAAAEPLRLGRVPGRDEIRRILFRRGASAGAGARAVRALDWTPDQRVPEHPGFPHRAVADALFLEGAAPPGRVFKGAAHLNTVLQVPGTPFPVVVRREATVVLRRERSFLSEHAVLRAIERSGVPVAAPRVLALGESHAADPGLRYWGDRFAVHTYEGARDLGRRPDHPVHGLRPHEADRLVDQLAALTEVDHAPVDPVGGRPPFYDWLSEQLVLLVAGLPEESQRLARFLGLPDAPRLREILARHHVADRDPALLHGDLNPWNLVRRDDHRALTLIDWEMALVGDPLYELVRHMHLTPTRSEIRDRMFRRWDARLPARFTRNWREDWRVYRWIEIVRSAYVDLDRLVTGASLDAPNVRRALDSYAMTLAAATASLGLSSRRRSGVRGSPRLTRALVRPTGPGGAA